jgi:NAD(P)-dependent dehydrogenase (short-subunit alcohol dehydrogenase family)
MRISELFNVEGRVALVTGAASGLGYACAEVLAENGAKVCLVDREAGGLERAAERSRAPSNVSGDSTSPSSTPASAAVRVFST